ncbi:MAG: aminotransferase class I/II-fold pyridoxal phosphate-dependent enzyme [Chloroflexi bacterium]|nr:aminotransferase class I/II-fold pyridoxal phosphate-dependent enzyme [Chloroflexota bacterium]
MTHTSSSPIESAARAYGWSPITDYPPFYMPAEIREGMIQALARGETHYAPVPGVPALREALARYLATLGWRLKADGNTVITNGEQEARFLAIQALCRDGKILALPAQAHPGVAQAAGVGQVQTISMPGSQDGSPEPDIAAILTALERGADVLYLESPHRLTGKAFEADELAAIAAAIEAADARVIWDQSLASLVRPDRRYVSPGAIAALAARCLALAALWPTLGMEEYQLGYIAGDEALIQPIQTLRQIIGICTTTPAQWAAVAGAEHMANLLQERLTELTLTQEQGLAFLQQARVTPLDGDTVAYLAFRAPWPRGASLLAELTQVGFLVASGEPFGAPDVVRLTTTSRLLAL